MKRTIGAAAVVLALTSVACGSDTRKSSGGVSIDNVSTNSGNSSQNANRGMDGGATDPDAGNNVVSDSGGGEEPDAESTDPDMGDPGPDLELTSKVFYNLGLEFSPGVTLTTPFEVEELTVDVEMFTVRETRGVTRVESQESGNRIMSVTSSGFGTDPVVGTDSATIARGFYDVYVENFGGTGSVDDYLAVKVFQKPTFDPSVATFEQTVVDLSGFLDNGAGTIQRFTVRDGYAYVAVGIRGRTEFFLAIEDQVQAAEAGDPFATEYLWDASVGDMEPNPVVLDLEPGDYGVIFGNQAEDGKQHGGILRIDEWRLAR